MNAGAAGAGARGASTESGIGRDHRAGGTPAGPGDDGGRLGRAERARRSAAVPAPVPPPRRPGSMAARDTPRSPRRSSSCCPGRELTVLPGASSVLSGATASFASSGGPGPLMASFGLGAGVLVVCHEGCSPHVLPGADRMTGGRAGARVGLDEPPRGVRRCGTSCGSLGTGRLTTVAAAVAGLRVVHALRAHWGAMDPCWSLGGAMVWNWVISHSVRIWGVTSGSRAAGVPSPGDPPVRSPRVPREGGCALRGQDRADRPRSRCRRAGPAPHARPAGATAGAGRRRQPGRPTRRLVVQRASAAGRPCAVWHNLPPRPPTRWSTAARASMSCRPFLVRLATVTTSLARNASTAGCELGQRRRRAARPARRRCRSGRPASRSPPPPRRTPGRRRPSGSAASSAARTASGSQRTRRARSPGTPPRWPRRSGAAPR